MCPNFRPGVAAIRTSEAAVSGTTARGAVTGLRAQAEAATAAATTRANVERVFVMRRTYMPGRPRLRERAGERVRATLAVERGRHDAARRSRSLAAGEEAVQLRMHERRRVAGNAQGGRRPGLDADDHRLVRQIAPELASEGPEPLAQRSAQRRRQDGGQIDGAHARRI